MLRSIAAVVAGFLSIMVLSLGADRVVRAVHPTAFDATGGTAAVPLLVLSVVYVGVFAIAGCWLTARLAPHHPMRHALILGALGLAFSLVGTTIAWDRAPVWYHVLQLALVMPYAWLGGWLGERRRTAAAPALG